ncbi:MAG TPA: DNA/RNA non-specific endonuclease [Verrucomicrobiae bacterium]
MRHLFVILVAGLLFASRPAQATIDATLQMQLGNPSNATTDPNNHDHYLIQRTVEAIDYNDSLGEPNWASWDLTAADIGTSGRSASFVTDTGLPSSFYEVTSDDYSGVGYDRGHMCPSADRTDNDTDNGLVFLMSNIIPQAASNNSGVWASFEGYCRSLAQAGNEVLIICGPSGFRGPFIQPSDRVLIPDYVWKIAVVVPAGNGSALSRISSATRVIAIKIPNNNSVNGSWPTYVTSAKQIEVDTGFTFFTALPPDLAETLRNKVDGLAAAPPTMTGISPASGAANSQVIITGNNFGSASAVTFNGVSASFVVNSGTQITATVPINSVSGNLSVTIPNGTAVSPNSFTVTGSTVDLAVIGTHFGNFSQGDTGDTYTLVITNVGTITATGLVTVADSLPAGLTATGISGVGWNVNPSTLTCTRSNILYAGASYPPIIVTVNVSASAPASVVNTASVVNVADANSSNNTVNDPTTINPSVSGGGTVVPLFGWDVHSLPGGSANYGPSPLAPTTTAANLTVGGLTRGSGIGTSSTGAARGWGGNTFTATTEAAAIAANEYATFTSTAQSGYTVSYTSLSKFDYRHSATGPANGVLQYQIGSGTFTDIAPISYVVDSSTSLGSLSPINLTGIAALQNISAGVTVTFRIVNYGGGSSAGTWYVFDVANSSASDLTVSGILAPVITYDLGIAMSATGSFTQGDTGDSYLITIKNNGATATTGLVRVTDMLPAGLTATSISGTGWTADLNTLTCTRSESLAPGASYPPITVVFDVATNALASVTNLATVTFANDVNPANNTITNVAGIVALLPVQSWRLQWFGTTANSGAAADTAISTADGMPNLLKYALGLNPLVSATNPVVGNVSSGYLSLMTPKNPAATDVTFTIEATDDLTTPWSTNHVTIDQNTSTLLQAHDNNPVTSSTNGFMRLKVTRP